MTVVNIPVSARARAGDAVSPDRDWMDRYWATGPGRWSAPPLPRVIVRYGSDQTEWITVYADRADGWVWTEYHDGHPLHAGGNWRPASRTRPSTLIRHPLTEERERWFTGLFLAAAPAALAAFPLPAELAAPLRAAGWTPEDLATYQTAGIRITTPADAAALASRPPAWWQEHRWPRHAGSSPPWVDFAAADIPRLIAAGLDGPTVDELGRGGLSTVEEMLAARPPAIPDDATRVRVRPRDGRIRATASVTDARAAIARWPSWWGPRTVIDIDREPVHLVSAAQGYGASEWLWWSDGLLEPSSLLHPAGLTGAARRAWDDALPHVPALDPLARCLIHAGNLRDLDRALLAGVSEHAAATADEPSIVLDVARPATYLGRPATIRRRVSLTAWTLHVPGAPRQVWIAEDTVDVERPDERGLLHRVRFAAATREQAEASARAWAADGRPAWTLPEAAEQLGMSHDALRTALHRAHRRDFGPRADAFLHVSPRLHRLPDLHLVLASRPGHGPGRGRTS